MDRSLAEFLVSFITFALVYTVICTLAEAFKAWVCHMFGDDTPHEYMTLDPVAHFNPFSVLFLAATGFIFARDIPINSSNITQPYRRLKIITAHLSSFFVYSLCAMASLVALIAIYGVPVLVQAATMIRYGENMSHLHLAHCYPDCSSVSLVFAFIFIATAYLSIILSVLDIIFDIFRIFWKKFVDQSEDEDNRFPLFFVIISIFFIIIFHNFLRLLMTNLMIAGGKGIASFIGLT